MKKLLVLVLVNVFIFIGGCSPDSQVASRNLSRAAEMFEINRRVIFYNGITGEYMLSVEGLCAIKADRADNQLELTCKIGQNEFKKHFLGLSDNVTYFVEQLEPAKANVYHYRVIFKPETIIPNIDLETSNR